MYSLVPFLVDSIFFGFIITAILLFFIHKKDSFLKLSTSKLIQYNNQWALVRALLIGILLVYQRSQHIPFEKWVIGTIALEFVAPLLFIKTSFRNSAKMGLVVAGAWTLSFIITALKAESFTIDLLWVLGKIITHVVLIAVVYFAVVISKEESYK